MARHIFRKYVLGLVCFMLALISENPAFADNVYACKVGTLFNKLALTKTTFSNDIFKAFGPEVKNFMGPALSLYLIILVILVWVTRNDNHFKKLIPTLACVGVAVILINNGISASDPYILQVSDAIENSSLAGGTLIVGKTAGITQLTPDSYTYIFNHHSKENGYAVLACQIENQAFSIAQIMIDIAVGDGSVGPVAVFRGIMCILAMLPFLFVVGIFGAFMLEAMFKYVAIAILAPVLIGLMWLRPVRTIGTAALRVLAGAWLTIILASGAMGFTLQGIDGFKTEMEGLLSGVRATSSDIAAKRFYKYCLGEPMYPNPSPDWWNVGPVGDGYWVDIDPADPDLQPPMTQAECDQAKQIKKNGAWIVLQPGFLIMPVIGFISILLHMQSKSLASNLSGANDGAGPAAAVVMGAKMLTGAGIAAGMRTLGGANTAAFGQGGFKSSVSDIMSGRSNVNPGGSSLQQMGQTMHQHGLFGGAARAMGLQPSAPPASNPLSGVGQAQYSTGGGDGGMFANPQDRREFMQDLGKIIADNVGNNSSGNGGRTRDG